MTRRGTASQPGPVSDPRLSLVDGDPAPGLVVFQNVTLPEWADRSALSRFGDDEWLLDAMAGKRTVNDLRIDFRSVPPAFRSTSKRLVWAWINYESRVDLLERATAVRTRISARTIKSLFNDEVRPWMRWLAAQGVERLCDVDDGLSRRYAQQVASESIQREGKAHTLFSVTRVWLMSPYLPSADRLPQPTWERAEADEPDTLDALLGSSDWTAENATQPVHPQTMSALLLCCMALVVDLQQDIVTAIGDKARMQASLTQHVNDGDAERVRDYLSRLRREDRPLPGTWGLRRPDSGKPNIARHYIASTLGVGLNALSSLADCGLPVSAGAPLPTAIQGRIDGRPWTDAIDYYDVEDLAVHLATAAYVVTGYLSGLRVEEARALEKGCCAPVEPLPGQPPHYLLSGKTFKDVIDESGNTIPGGADRSEPWTVIEPVAEAIAVAERLSEGSLLFPHDAFTRNPRIQGATERAVTAATLRDAIDDLIPWWNDLVTRLNLPHHAIPPDPEGKVAPLRFRRTLAWFIYRLPAGRIALGIHYGHIKSVTTDAYGSRVRSGLRDVFPMEEALVVSEYLNEAADRLDAGEAVSGPAADRYINGVRKYQATYDGTWLTPRQSAELLRDPDLRIYDNGYQPLACAFNQATAGCRTEKDRALPPDIARTPDPTRCQRNCANIAMTDSHVREMREEIAERQEEIDSPLTPDPMKARLQQRIERLEDDIARHETTKRSG